MTAVHGAGNPPRLPSRVDLAHVPGFALGQLLVRPALCEVEGATIHRLEPRIMQVLCALAEAEGGVVSRDELIERCWEGRIVGEDSVSRCIARLRQLAQAEPGGFEIKTLTRVGYRLSAVAPMPTAPKAVDPSKPPPTSEIRTPQPDRPWLDRRSVIVTSSVLILLLILPAWLLSQSPPRWQLDQIRPFVSTEDGAQSPALSPSGDLIAYSAAGVDGASHIFLRNLHGGDRIQLTSGPGETMPRWLPDRGELAYSASPVNDPCRLMAIAVPAGRPHELLRCTDINPASYAVAPDGGALFYSDADSPMVPMRLMRLNLQTGARSAVNSDLKDQSQSDAVGDISPDGRYLAFRRVKGPTDHALAVLDLRTGVVRTVWQANSDKWDAVTWLDNRTLLAAWRRADDRALFAVPLDGPRTRLTSGTQAFYSLSRDVDGLIATQTNFALQTLVTLEPDGRQVQHLTSEGLVADPAFAADGSLAFIAESAGEQALWMARPRSSPVKIAGFGTHQAYHPAWSPDGRLIAISQVIDNVPHLRLLDLDGVLRRDITLPGWDVGRSFWSADGRQITVATASHPGRKLWRYDLATGHMMHSDYTGWSDLRLDGDVVYGTDETIRGSTRAIWQIFPQRRLITNQLAMSRFSDWAVVKGEFYIVEQVDSTHDRLVRRNLDGKVLQSWNIGITPWLGSIAVNPQNGVPALVQVTGGRNDIYLMRASH